MENYLIYKKKEYKEEHKKLFAINDKTFFLNNSQLESSKTSTASLKLEIPKIQLKHHSKESEKDLLTTVSGKLNCTNAENIDFEAIELQSINGFVSYNGKGLSNVKVDAGDLGTFVTKADGVFLFENIKEGTEYSITLTKPSYIFDTPCFSGVLEKDLTIKTDSSRLFSIAGTILHKGIPVKGVNIDAGVLGHFLTDEYGSFLIKDVHESVEYELRPSKKGYLFSAPGSSGSLRAGSVSLLFAAKKLHSVSGKIKHKGKPLSNALVIAKGYPEVKTDAEGAYTIENIPEESVLDINVFKDNFKFNLKKTV